MISWQENHRDWFQCFWQKNSPPPSFSVQEPGANVIGEELTGKIEENARLHKQVCKTQSRGGGGGGGLTESWCHSIYMQGCPGYIEAKRLGFRQPTVLRNTLNYIEFCHKICDTLWNLESLPAGNRH